MVHLPRQDKVVIGCTLDTANACCSLHLIHYFIVVYHLNLLGQSHVILVIHHIAAVCIILIEYFITVSDYFLQF